jgi:hypothetical protein
LKRPRARSDKGAILQRNQFPTRRSLTGSTCCLRLSKFTKRSDRRLISTTGFDPIDVLNYTIELRHTQAELAELLHPRSRASKILVRRRPLTVIKSARRGKFRPIFSFGLIKSNEPPEHCLSPRCSANSESQLLQILVD